MISSFGTSMKPTDWLASSRQALHAVQHQIPNPRSLLQQLLLSTSLSSRDQTPLRGTSASCHNTQLSCHNSSIVADTCCFNAPGGQLLQTQYSHFRKSREVGDFCADELNPDFGTRLLQLDRSTPGPSMASGERRTQSAREAREAGADRAPSPTIAMVPSMRIVTKLEYIPTLPPSSPPLGLPISSHI